MPKVRDEPFFIDLVPWILPDRRPGTGPLSTPSTATATAFRPVGQAVNVLNGANVASLVIELPTAQLTAGGNARRRPGARSPDELLLLPPRGP